MPASRVRASASRSPKQPPKELDFDLWLGPAPQQPYHENIVHYNWHWFWDFGNGEIGNQGVHQMDICRWAMPEGAVPKGVISLGGRFGYKDQGQTPNTQLSIIDFGGPKIFFEDRGLVEEEEKITNEFCLEGGAIQKRPVLPQGQDHGRAVGQRRRRRGPTPAVAEGRLQEAGDRAVFTIRAPAHFANFIDCVRNRTPDKLNAPVREGHLSSALAHLANTSYRLGKEVPFSQETKALGDDKAAGEAFESMKEHLVHAAKLKLEDSTYRLGRQLEYDAKTERFVDDDEANKLITGPYRAPYVVPETYNVVGTLPRGLR